MWTINSEPSHILDFLTKNIDELNTQRTLLVKEKFREYEDKFKLELHLLGRIQLLLSVPNTLNIETIKVIKKYYECTCMYDCCGELQDVIVCRKTNVPIDINDFEKLTVREYEK